MNKKKNLTKENVEKVLTDIGFHKIYISTDTSDESFRLFIRETDIPVDNYILISSDGATAMFEMIDVDHLPIKGD